MQIPSLSSSIPSALGSNVRADGVQESSKQSGLKSASDESVQALGSGGSGSAVQSPEQGVQATTVNPNEAAASTKVVTSADEVLGTSLGLNIDVTV